MNGNLPAGVCPKKTNYQNNGAKNQTFKIIS